MFKVTLSFLFFLLCLAGIEDIYKEDFPIGDNFGESLLEELYLRPLDINRASIVDLLRLPGMEFDLASNIIEKRKEKGSFKELAEVREVKGMNEELWQEIIPFLTLNGYKEKVSFKCRTNLKDLERVRDIYNLTSGGFRKGDLSFHFLSESDYQEEVFDFTSFNLTYDNKGDKFILGDFLLTSSELLFSPPYYSYYQNHLRGWQQDRLEAVKFAAETHYFRGVGIAKKGNISPFLFLSSKTLTALGEGQVKRILYSGEHNDSLSKALKGNLREQTFGAGWGINKKGFQLGNILLFANYNQSFSFGRNLFSTGISIRREMANHHISLEMVQSFPGGQGFGMKIIPKGRRISYRLGFYYLKKDFFSIYGRFPNILPEKERLFYDGEFSFSLPVGKFVLSYNTRTDFTYDSLPQRIKVEWKSKGNGWGLRIYQRRNIREKEIGSGVEIKFKFSPSFSGDLGIEDKYKGNKRGFKFTGKVNLSYKNNVFSLHGYKTILSEGIDFYHLEPEGYKENEFINEEMDRIILGWSGKIKGWRLNTKFGVKRKDNLSFDFKQEIIR